MPKSRSSGMWIRAIVAAIVVALSICVLAVYGQSTAPKKPKKPVPPLTNDDFEPRRAAASSSSTPAAERPATEGKSAASADAAKGLADETKPEGEAKKADPEELAWREKISKARARLRELTRASETAELELIDLQNSLSASNRLTVASVKRTNEAIEAGRVRTETLKTQLAQAQAELDTLEQAGRDKKYEEAPALKPEGEDGTPNREYYVARYQELTGQYSDAIREQRLYELKASELRQRLQTGKKSADEFYLGPIREELNQTLVQAERARSAAAKAREAIENLFEQARRAGIEPGIFR